jgi:hypothetical protein
MPINLWLVDAKLWQRAGHGAILTIDIITCSMVKPAQHALCSINKNVILSNLDNRPMT